MHIITYLLLLHYYLSIEGNFAVQIKMIISTDLENFAYLVSKDA